MLRIRLLGQFALSLDGQAVDLSARAAQALLAWLALNAPRRQPRERLADLLWPDADAASARQGLRNALWKLRSAIGDGYLTSDKFTVGLSEEAPWDCDAISLLTLDESGASDAELTRVLDAYAGELLPGFYEDWISQERERLASAFERKVAVLVARHEAAGRWNEALDWSEKWLSRAGTAEPAYRTLMRAHAALGDRAGVGAAYRRCIAALDEDLGLPPSEATVALYDDLARETGSAPVPVPAARATAPTPPRRGPAFLVQSAPPLVASPRPVARDAELGALSAALQDALAGNGRLVLLEGEAGAGKSTLLDALIRLTLESSGEVAIARGSCDAFVGEGRAFGPFSEAFRMLTGDVEAPWAAGRLSSEHARRLWDLMPRAVESLLGRARPLLGTLIDGGELAQRAAAYAAVSPLPRVAELASVVGPRDVGTAAIDQSVLFEACTEFLIALSQERPLMLLLDDMHWMDASSAALLLHLSRRLAGTRLVIVGAYRPEAPSSDAPHPLHAILGEIKRTLGKVSLELGPRDRAAARAFIDALVDREANQFSETFREMLAERTGGHALFAVELLDDLKERGTVVKDSAGQWVVRSDAAHEGLPARVEGVLQSRFGRVDDGLRRALAIAAVEGEEFTAEVVAQVAGVDTWRLLEQLASDAGQRHRLVQELGTVNAGGRRLTRFRFRHNLFQRFLYDGLGPSLRPHLHDAVAAALESLHGDRSELLAVALSRHYLAADLPQRALPYLLAAGRQANRMAAHRAAQEHLEAALEALESMPPGLERDDRELDVRLELVVALHVSEGFGSLAVGGHGRRAVALAEALKDSERHFRALWNHWLHHAGRYDARETQAVAQELLEAAEGGDSERVLQAHHAAWSACHMAGDFQGLRRHLAEGASRYDESRHGALMAAYGGHDPGVCRLCYEARLLLQDAQPTEALERVDEALALAERLGHGYGIAQANAVKVEILTLMGAYAEAVAWGEKALAFADTHGFPFWRGVAALGMGVAQAWLGQESGLETVRAFIAGVPAAGEAISPSLRAYEASACLALGRFDEGLAAVTAGIEAVETTRERAALAELYELRAQLTLAAGSVEVSTIVEDLERATAIAEERELPMIARRTAQALTEIRASQPRA